ncbi:hypothetical protein I546_4199 [Mycobacterium kansasii 732]|nr:hypothetical protein I546_4199 [Mycobacterium kansasii 732]
MRVTPRRWRGSHDGCSGLPSGRSFGRCCPFAMSGTALLLPSQDRGQQTHRPDDAHQAGAAMGGPIGTL